MASASWQEELRQRLVERNTRESAYAGIIDNYRKLAQQTRLLKERNQQLLRAVNSARTNPGGSGGGGSNPEESNAVRSAYISSLESQISSLRDEMAAVYKTQGQNAQRLLAMNETLREKEDVARAEAESLRKAREEISVLRRKVDQHNELMAEKDRGIQVLHDEVQSLNLELNQVTARNEALSIDNASLLQRWLDHVNDAASKMNAANMFYEDMVTRGWQNKEDAAKADGGSGKGSANGDDPFLIPAKNQNHHLGEGLSLGPNG
ncbi:hypothetical protein BOTBODRAFT_62158 [Botryobasidium botryosum FD-172 SS1]|uniref:Autophagy-related protein 16 domain-containing protein n=1 Tax=Botryobasidium botryosum (strain FD-172 SS1) TaxID=930990 RepID=A0A067MVT6_BOTB1|nr:hypothetical protein BOTBODRAFT_62158 [Botryobasidium botryosum FD-172 SS1]